ncbi:hypothetical protein [Oleomonas cavernae]|uniref:hypothetical protein n=1 Tax=Oleomonas cavernae TaxID=2320859 RepID=UPI0018F779E4|nr:hypothetical protein [Oleomonas cavernae]
MSETAALRQGPATDAWSMPLAEIDVSDPARFRDDTMWPFFERLRREDPVHWCANGMYGPYWSVTKYKDIMQVETSHHIFSSDTTMGGITIEDGNASTGLPMFIAMDPPSTTNSARR